ncbi:hypothetical protein ONS95_004347 [Cadophora gregata]|uniref:uncharacterized protein n=1 Tax=Cadophora gregata TaxID=51156 RepID=UPI0026DBACAC|nr:uncharacterized protein ONS95_004347 [Cadophora gregata]KAK0105267.1 hypothetical protein ONS96_004664 [Cadophora gregata f. sp. sojae]KAK0105832.1 hypothetical protein ONS95_004347 [Cadophora gregata]
MKVLNIILGFTASVSAIDIGLRNWGNCDSRGGGWVCTNYNPNVCCGIPSGSVSSVVFYAVPTNWNLEVRGHEGGNCARTRTTDSLFGGTEKCLNSGPYTGAGYGFRGKKRGTEEGACSQTVGKCTSTVMPDVLFLGDGQKYNIVNMDQGLIDELAELANNGSGVADVPEVFKAFEIAA